MLVETAECLDFVLLPRRGLALTLVVLVFDALAVRRFLLGGDFFYLPFLGVGRRHIFDIFGDLVDA